MKSEKTKIDLIFRSRHCLAFITVLVFLLTYGLSVSAAQTGSYITTNLISYYSIQGTSIPLGSDVVLERASLDGFDITKITAQPSGVYSNDLPSYMNGTSGSKFYIVDSIADDSTQVTYDFSSSQYHVFYKSATSSNTFSYACIGNGNFALLGIGSNNFAIVSDAPFIFGRYQDWGSGGAYWANNVSTPLANGLYVQSETYMQIGFTDMPYYLPTSDSSSGWSSYSTSSTDFSFSNTNYDFNYALTGGSFVNPNAPLDNPDEVQPFSSQGMNFVFGSVDPEFISTSDDKGIYAEYNFHLNSYMLTHPNEFTFHMEYDIIATTVIGDGKFEYNRTITVSDILVNNDQTFAHNMLWYDFEDSNDYNLGQLLNRIYTNAGNQSSSYTNGSVISYDSGNPGHTRTFGKMTSGVRNIYDNDVDSMKFYYTCYFVWHGDPETTSGKLKGWKDLKSANNNTTQNDISNNYYPPSSDLASQYPSNSGGSTGNTTNNGGVFNDGDVIIYNNDGLWTPYTLDQVSYANVKGMFEDIKDFVDSSSTNSFWSVLTGVLKPTSLDGYIPDKIWEYITISVAVICGFAVVRYVLRR